MVNYSKISRYFSDKLGKKCDYVEDKKTMFLTIDSECHKIKKECCPSCDCSKKMEVEKIISLFEKKLDI